MGNTTESQKLLYKQYDDKIVLSFYAFTNLEQIANGIYGPIFRCDSKFDFSFAPLGQKKKVVMIQYLKERVLLSRSLYSIMNELSFYKQHNFKCPFIVKAKYAFQDKSSFYLIQEYVECGDLRFHLNRKVINESRAKFLIACLIIGTEFLHNIGYIHRNLKPENLLLDSNGYLKINDFKLLREASKVNYFDSSGTPGYMAPEVIFRQSHGRCSDIFSIGVIAYEMMMNKLPFKGANRKEYTEELMSEKEFLIKERDLPEGWSRDCADFINRCLQKRAINRLGYNGIEELKENRWFRGFKWKEMEKMKIKALFLPQKGVFRMRGEKEDVGLKGDIRLYLEFCDVNKLFEGYYYNYITDFDKRNEKGEQKEEREVKNEREEKEIKEEKDEREEDEDEEVEDELEKDEDEK